MGPTNGVRSSCTVIQPLECAHREQREAASQHVIDKIRPSEGGADQRLTHEGASDQTWPGMVGQLQNLEDACGNEHGSRDDPRPATGQHEQNQQAPEHLVEYAAY